MAKIGEKAVATIVNEYTQLDQGTFSGKSAVQSAAHKIIINEERN